MPKTFHARDVEEAIQMAEDFKVAGDYDWFRGQVKPWPPVSTLFRFQEKYGEHWEEKLVPRWRRLIQFYARHEPLNWLLDKRSAFQAVAQHYGVPTNLIDFTTDPAVAGFFASDTSQPDLGSDSCIYCLDTSRLRTIWDLARETRGEELPDISFYTSPVPNLWRLEAQSGVFLFCETNWHSIFPMDRIVFPYSGYPSYPTHRDIYPDRKSQLELLLDSYFDNEGKLEGSNAVRGALEALKLRGGAVTIIDQEEEAPRMPIGTPHKSWASVEQWLQWRREAYSDVPRTEAVLAVSLDRAAEDLERSVRAGVLRLINRNPQMRQSHIL